MFQNPAQCHPRMLEEVEVVELRRKCCLQQLGQAVGHFLLSKFEQPNPVGLHPQQYLMPELMLLPLRRRPASQMSL